MDVQGEGQDVWSWIDLNELYRFDCSKLDQWEIVFDHMEKSGLMIHIVTQEIENEVLLDIGELDVQRKLYYRELIERFYIKQSSEIQINKYGLVHCSPKDQNDDDRKGEYIISFSMREDGFKFDKWILTKNCNFTPK